MLIWLVPAMTMIVYLSSSNMSELSTLGDYLSNKVTVNTTGSSKGSRDMEAERSTSFFNYIEVSLTDRPILGNGDVNERNDRWDFVSTYLYGYGIPGFATMFMTVALILRKAPIEYYVSILVAMTSNGNLQIPMYLVMFPIIFLCKKSDLNRI